jgi:hypothetical protein
MWELICHHTYDWHGLPIDRSVYDNHGEAHGVDVLPDGAAPGSGALRFKSGSGISIPLRPPCRPLRAVRVECVIRLTDPGLSLRPLIECPDSFLLVIYESYLVAVHTVRPGTPDVPFPVAGPGFHRTFGYLGFHNDGVSTLTHGVGGQTYQVPLNRWVEVAFEHDGISAMRLYADGRLVAERGNVLAGVRSAGEAGLRIGDSNQYGGYEFIGGDLDEIKLWRHDPRSMWREFAQRPIDERAAACWHDFLLRIEELLRADPDCARLLLSGFNEIVLRMLRTIAAHGPGAVKHHKRYCDEYQRLWRAGTIDGPEMADLMQAWIAWMRSLGVIPEADAELQALLASDCFRRLWETSPGLACDARFAGMMDLFIQAAQPRRAESSADPPTAKGLSAA